MAAAARRAAAATPVDEPISRVDQVFTFIEETRLATRIFDPPGGWFATVGGMAEGNGFTAGGGYRFPLGSGTLSARGVGSFRRSYLADVTWHQPLTESGRVFMTVNAGRRNEAKLLFSGLGPRPALDESVDFALEATLADATVGVRLTPRITARAGVGYLSPDVDVPAADLDDDDPTLSSYFTETTAPGLTSQPAFVVMHAGLLVDHRDAPNARAGGLYAFDVRRFGDRADGRASFTAARVEAQRYLSFWNRSRVLALRVVADQLRDDEGAAAPFYLRPTIGGSRTLRGFERQRFRDNGLLLLQAEYRYEINAFVMGAVFADAGQAAPSLRRMQWRDLHTDYGIGLRLGYSTGVALRTDLAFGGDVPVRLVFTFSAAF
jgi:outer membrane protein assembly factor BamA